MVPWTFEGVWTPPPLVTKITFCLTPPPTFFMQIHFLLLRTIHHPSNISSCCVTFCWTKSHFLGNPLSPSGPWRYLCPFNINIFCHFGTMAKIVLANSSIWNLPWGYQHYIGLYIFHDGDFSRKAILAKGLWRRKNPAYGRHWISGPMRIVAPIPKRTDI